MGIFELKYRDTLPILDVVLHDPAPKGSPESVLGPIHDLTGSTDWHLHIWMSDGTKLIRDMAVQGDPALGKLRYVWATTDWDAGAGGPPFTSGGLFVSPTLPLSSGEVEHRMEYEVIGPGTSRTTFPNSDYDILRILTDIGQG